MTWTEADIPDLSGRVAVVTGGNGGLGLATVKGLAGAKAHVVMAARNQEKAAGALAEVNDVVPNANVEVVELDLGDLASVQRGADEISEAPGSVDILVNNAGLMALPRQQTADGFEMQFGVNHLGHWAFTAHLLPALLRADSARVVTVTSTGHHMAWAVDPENPHLEGNYKPWRAYYRSKLANYYFALGLDAQFRDAGVATASLAAHPGLTDSDLQTTTVDAGQGGRLGNWSRAAAHRMGMSERDGARPQLRAATDPQAHGGELYGPRYGGSGPAVKRPVLRPGREKSIASLWQMSERETGIALDVAAAQADL
jgi:NAD(P)-dependent dehydrogenase (short-subunit alcohol dehydrogenase family)